MYVENNNDPLVQTYTWDILGYPGIIGRKSSALKAPAPGCLWTAKASSWRTLWKWCLLRTSSGSCRVLQTCWMLSAFLLSVSLYWKPGRFFDKLRFLTMFSPFFTTEIHWELFGSHQFLVPVSGRFRICCECSTGWMWTSRQALANSTSASVPSNLALLCVTVTVQGSINQEDFMAGFDCLCGA